MVVETYPADSGKFLKNQQDPFANPVGRNIHQGLETILNELLGEMDYKSIVSFLDPVIRIRAVQNFSPSEAIAFVFFLKNITREVLKKEREWQKDIDGLLQFESKIDEVGLLAFDVYMQCREKLYEIKSTEMRNSMFKAFERAGLIREMPGSKPDPADANLIQMERGKRK